jgi:hypothetical protein
MFNMSLTEIESSIKPLSRPEKIRLIRAIEKMLQEEPVGDESGRADCFFDLHAPVGSYEPVIMPEFAQKLEEMITNAQTKI